MAKQMAFPVRFVAEGQTVQTTSRELGEDYIFVRCVEPPGAGERVVLRLYLPGISEGDSIQAQVTESDEDGFLASFDNIADETREHIRAALHAREVAEVQVEPVGHENRRALPRYLDNIHVKLGDEPASVANLSAAGLFLLTDAPPGTDAIVQVILDLPDNKPPLRVQALVVRRVLPGLGERAGAGLQFIAADDAFRERLDAHLEALRKK